MTDEERRAAFVEAKERSLVMLDDDLREEAVAAEIAAKAAHRVHRTDGHSTDWAATMPREPEAAPAAPVRRGMTDAVSARLMAEIDRRIAAAVNAALAEVERTIGEHRAVTAEWIRASAQAIVQERKHRDEHDLRISALLAEVEKMQRGIDAKVIDLPSIPLKDRSRAG